MKLSAAAPSLLLGTTIIGCLPHLSKATLRGQEKAKKQAPDVSHRRLPKQWGCKITPGATKVGIYIGSGIDPSSSKWAQALASFWQTGMRGPPGSGYENTPLNVNGGATYTGDATIEYVTLTNSEMERCYNDELDSLSLFVVPGGTAYGIQDAIGSNGKAAIKRYLDNGGNYIGFCAGGYYLASGYYWKGESQRCLLNGAA